jgi:hypothetical protein
VENNKKTITGTAPYCEAGMPTTSYRKARFA